MAERSSREGASLGDSENHGVPRGPAGNRPRLLCRPREPGALW